MSIRNLEFLFKPTSVAVIGASNRPRRIGSVVVRNLLTGGFSGPVLPVNPKYEAVAGVLAYRDIPSLPVAPDMAIICTPPSTVPNLIRELGERGTHAAVVLTAGMGQQMHGETAATAAHSEAISIARTFQQAMLDAARPNGLRILGPNCLGLLVPEIGLNATFAHTSALPGSLAFISQSGALCTAVLDWAKSNEIGFSYFVSLGDLADVDFGDVLDYFESDPKVSAVLLYIESITHARKFMSAARAAARNKPLLAIKAGRVADGARAATSHTGSLSGSDDVYQAAFDRAGMLRVFEIDELFDAVETLGCSKTPHGDRLAILTNGGGLGVMATDTLVGSGGRLAQLSSETMQQLDAILPATWSHGNPVDMIGDASGERYAAALRVLLRDNGVDAILVLYSPTAIVSSDEAARAVIQTVGDTHRNVLTSWLGRGAVASARHLFSNAGIATYDTPEHAVRGFMHTVNYARSQEMLSQIPPSIPSEFTPATTTAQLVVEKALAGKRQVLTEPESKAMLASYGIPVVETQIASGADDAVGVAEKLGYPVAIKIISPDITHKSDVGGVALDLETSSAVRAAVCAITDRLAKLQPDARLSGFTVQKMARRPGAHELIIGVATDALFGPVILFGHGGTGVEVIADRAIALPPLNMHLARELVSRTRVFKLLQGYRDRPAADLDAICLTLIKVSQLIIDIAEIAELDINPLLADQNGVLALDARIRVLKAPTPGQSRLAIRPYPKALEETVTIRSGRQVLMRPIRPEDEPDHHLFISRLTPEDKRFRFFGAVREFSHPQMSRFTQNDYDREMAFIATAPNEHGQSETLGVVRTVSDPDNTRAEFAVVVRSDLKGQGLGRALMEKSIRYCRDRGIHEMWGQILGDNFAMLHLAGRLGFEQRPFSGTGEIEVSLKLTSS
jgi:acetyltransferase